jgi:hypothetical protein
LWQINVRPEANPKYKNWKLTDPFVNAKAAHELFTSNGLRPWNHKGGPLGGTNVAQARAWVRAYKGGSSTAGSGATGGTGGAGGAGGTGPSKDALDRKIAANQTRIDKLRQQVRHLPTGRKSRPQRIKLQDEISTLLSRNRRIRGQIRDLPKGADDTPTPMEQQQAAQALALAQTAQRLGAPTSRRTRSPTRPQTPTT